MFTRKHFRLIAEVIAQIENLENRKRSFERFNSLFSKNNPHFKSGLFQMACNVED